MNGQYNKLDDTTPLKFNGTIIDRSTISHLISDTEIDNSVNDALSVQNNSYSKLSSNNKKPKNGNSRNSNIKRGGIRDTSLNASPIIKPKIVMPSIKSDNGYDLDSPFINSEYLSASPRKDQRTPPRSGRHNSNSLRSSRQNSDQLRLSGQYSNPLRPSRQNQPRSGNKPNFLRQSRTNNQNTVNKTHENPSNVRPNQPNSRNVRPNQPNSRNVRPNQPNPRNVRHNQPNPRNVRPNQANPSNVRPNQANPSNVRPNQANQRNMRPNQANQRNVKPNQANQRNMRPNQANQRNVRPNQANQRNVIPSQIPQQVQMKKLPMPNFSIMDDVGKEQYWMKYTLNLNRIRETRPDLAMLIPKITEKKYEDLPILHTRYDYVLNYFITDSDIQHYKTYMAVVWTIIEGLGRLANHYMGINITGFLKLQMSTIRHYDAILWELGEKEPLNIGAGWHPLLKLFLFSVGTAVCLAFINFIIKRYISEDADYGTMMTEKVVGFLSGFMTPPSVAGVSTGSGIPGTQGPGSMPDIPNSVPPASDTPDVSSFFGGFDPSNLFDMVGNNIGNLAPMLGAFMGGDNNNNDNSTRERKQRVPRQRRQRRQA